MNNSFTENTQKSLGKLTAMANDTVSPITQNTIISDSQSSSNSFFWISIGVITILIIIAIVIHLYWNYPTLSSTTKQSQADTTQMLTPTPSLSENASSSDIGSSISYPNELTDTSMSANHNENEYIISNGSGSVNTQSNFDPYSDNSLNKALNNASTSFSQSNVPVADDSYSSTIQSSNNKSGWCYIGEERGYRTCLQVGENDTCMSGDIFPSRDICINPSLRA